MASRVAPRQRWMETGRGRVTTDDHHPAAPTCVFLSSSFVQKERCTHAVHRVWVRVVTQQKTRNRNETTRVFVVFFSVPRAVLRSTRR